MSSIKLSEAQVGRKYLIVKIEGEGLVKRRILDMGLTPGTEITVVKVAPLGDPIEIMIKGFPISIRKGEASSVIVREVSEGVGL